MKDKKVIQHYLIPNNNIFELPNYLSSYAKLFHIEHFTLLNDIDRLNSH